MDVIKTLINVNGVTIPGISRDGAFVREANIIPFIQYRAINLDANEARRFIIDRTCTIEAIVIADTTSNPNYTFTVTTNQGFVWTFAIPGSQIINFTNTKVINFPPMVLDKGFIVSFTPLVAITSLAVLTKPALNVDLRDF